MSWKETYSSKLVSSEEAVKLIKSNDVLFIGGAATVPYPLVDALVDRADELENVRIISTLLLSSCKLFTVPGLRGRINHETMFYGGYDKMGTKIGNTAINSIQFTKMADTLRERYKVNVLMIEGTEPDEEGYISLGATGVTWAGEVAEYAEKIIILTNNNHVRVRGQKTKIHIDQVDLLYENNHPLPELPQPQVTENDKVIANILVDYIPDGACIQIGLGGLANAVGYGLTMKKNLSVRTEMMTDSMVALAKQGVINGKIIAAFGLGSRECYDYCENPQVELAPISWVNNPYEIGKHDNFISINSCLMVDLTGQICSESIGTTQFSSIGGQLDFVRGAALSKGGKSFLCMPSTFVDKQGQVQSKIYFELPPGAVVTTPRADAMYVVTEYGVADVYCKSIEDRVEAMISIAHPDFRDELRAKAIAAKMLPA